MNNEEETSITQINRIEDIPIQIKDIEGKFKVQRLLSGKGNGQGKVFLVTHNHRWYAAKLLIHQSHFDRQVLYVSKIQKSKYISEFIYANQKATIHLSNGGTIYLPVIIMEFAEYGDLLDFFSQCYQFHRNKGQQFSIPIRICKAIFKQILNGVQFIHDQQILHRDIKLSNVLIGQNFQIKITDFGLSASINQTQFHDCVGTQPFMAPEVYKYKYSNVTDIFACSVLFYLLCSFMIPPFQAANDKNQRYRAFSNKVKSNRLQLIWKSLRINFPEDVKQYFKVAFLKQPSERPEIYQIQKSQLFDIDCADETELKEFFENEYNRILSVADDKSKISEIEQIKQRINSQLKQMNQSEYRDASEESQLQKMLSFYEERCPDKESIDLNPNMNTNILFSAQLYNLVGLLHYYVQNSIKEKTLFLFKFMDSYKLREYKVDYSNQKAIFSIKLLFDFETKQKTTIEQGEQIELLLSNTVLIEGKLFKIYKKQQELIGIQWQNADNMAVNFLKKDLDRILQALQAIIS